MNREPQLDGLMTFLAVARLGRYTAAAEAIGVHFVSASGTTGTTNHTRAISYTAGFARHWKVGYRAVDLPHSVGEFVRRYDPRPVLVDALPAVLALAVAIGLSRFVGDSFHATVVSHLLPLVPVGVALAIVDLRTRMLPTVVVWPTLAAVVVLATVSAVLSGDLGALARAAAGGVGVFAFFYALWWIHPAGMGFGDVRLSAVLGFALGYLGWPELLIGIYGGFLAFSVPGLAVALARRDRGVLRSAYPFGPFLLGGALAGVVLGETVWAHLGTG